MRRSILLFLLLGIFWNLYAQDRTIDYESVRSWKKLGQYGISSNAKYIWYENTSLLGDSLIITSIDSRFRRSFANAGGAMFSEDCKSLIFKQSDAVNWLNLDLNQLDRYLGASQFVCSPQKEWLAIFFDTCLLVKSLNRKKNYRLPKVDKFIFSSKDDAFLYSIGDSLFELNLANGRNHLICKGEMQGDIILNKIGNLILVILKGDGNNNDLFCYRKDKEGWQNIDLIDSIKLQSSYLISDINPWFGDDENYIFFKIKKRPQNVDTKKPITDRLNVWHYKDRWPQSQQLLTTGEEISRTFTAVYLRREKEVVFLENSDSVLVGNPKSNYVVKKRRTNDDEAFWNTNEVSNYRLLNIAKRSEFQFMPDSVRYGFWDISPQQKYVIYIDTITHHVFCYEIKIGKTVDITKDISSIRNFKNMGVSRPLQYEFAGWSNNEKMAIIYDRYDIWIVDPSGKRLPVCLTGGWGAKNNVILRFAHQIEKLRVNDLILITGLKDDTRWNGIFKSKLGWDEIHVEDNLGPFLDYFPGMYMGGPPAPLKAGTSDVFLFQRQSDTLAPNLFLTRDFKSVKQLSFFCPQKNYNWLTSSLLHWQNFDGGIRMGLLYKPQNFDSTKKYPIIFHYYELKSRERFRFPQPDLSIGDLNIPWFVNRGYLVFIPDIWGYSVYKGKGALSTVVSAANYLTERYTWIDKQKMGLQGHSFGGFETNYIVTHSELFAAAQSSAGPVDFISGYGGVGFGGKSLANIHEEGQLGLRTTPWTRPDVYIETSPLFGVEKIKTPLLLMHNRRDFAVSFTQSLELYTAMRRLKKKVWLLEYDDEEHTLGSFECKMDFTIRQQQFFDYYLKQYLPPIWMTKGIPAYLKGIYSGLELDTSGIEP